jgi:mannose-1-phosphate guanylyltransferase / mannose-6-phosphate isomerase
MKMIVIILSGGSGSRLWPISREDHPKPFIRLADGKSLLQKSFLRAAALPSVEEVLTVTNRQLTYLTLDDYAEVNTTGHRLSFILEPVGRNTAPAIISAALKISKEHDPNTLMLVLPADHIVSDQCAFEQAVAEAVKLASVGRLVTFGIKPTSPETGFGYMESEGNNVLRFVEKPTAEKAQSYIDTGNYYWNSGIFCFAAGALLSQMAEHSPIILNAVKDCMSASIVENLNGYERLLLDKASFERVPDHSIDYALLEKSNNIAVIPCDFGWSDIGSWLAITQLVEPDSAGNRLLGHALLHDVNNVSVHATHRLVSVVGLSDIIVIETSDAVLVVNKHQTQDVKYIFNSLKNAEDELHRLHNEVHRPWGSYTVLQNSEAFKVKRIFVKPGHRLSLQSHKYRAEHWVVVSGVADVINDDKRFSLNAGESTFIEAGHVHQLLNPGQTALEIIEVQTGAYLGEDDIERYSDRYGRT